MNAMYKNIACGSSQLCNCQTIVYCAIFVWYETMLGTVFTCVLILLYGAIYVLVEHEVLTVCAMVVEMIVVYEKITVMLIGKLKFGGVSIGMTQFCLYGKLLGYEVI